MRYSSVETFFHLIPAGPVTNRLMILQERFQKGYRHPHGCGCFPYSTRSYLVFCALDLTMIFRVWLTKAGRVTPSTGVGAKKIGK